MKFPEIKYYGSSSSWCGGCIGISKIYPMTEEEIAAIKSKWVICLWNKRIFITQYN